MDKNEEERKLEKIRIVSREEVTPIIIESPFKEYQERQLAIAEKIVKTNIVDYPDYNDYNIQFHISNKKFIAMEENEIVFTDKTYDGLINQIKKATKKILKQAEVICLGKFYRSISKFQGRYYNWYDMNREDLEYLIGKITSFKKTSDYIYSEPSLRLWFTGKNDKSETRRSNGALHCFTLDNDKNRKVLENIIMKYDELNKFEKQIEEIHEIIERQKEDIIELCNGLDRLTEEDLFNQ